MDDRVTKTKLREIRLYFKRNLRNDFSVSEFPSIEKTLYFSHEPSTSSAIQNDGTLISGID